LGIFHYGPSNHPDPRPKFFAVRFVGSKNLWPQKFLHENFLEPYVFVLKKFWRQSFEREKILGPQIPARKLFRGINPCRECADTVVNRDRQPGSRNRKPGIFFDREKFSAAFFPARKNFRVIC